MKAATNKSKETWLAIVSTATDIARKQGISAISVRNVASKLNISKSGVFNRIESVEELQASVLEEYGRQFFNEVFHPSLSSARGFPQLLDIIRRWLQRVSKYQSISEAMLEEAAFSSASANTHIFDIAKNATERWIQALRKCLLHAMEEGQLKQEANIREMLFELHSILLGILHSKSFLGRRDSIATGYALLVKLLSRNASPKGRRIIKTCTME